MPTPPAPTTTTPQRSGHVTHMAVELLDAHGALIECFNVPVDEAIRAVTTFMRTHGTDPDEHGAGASRGSIRFAPAP